MKAVRIGRYGGNEEVRLDEIDPPRAGPGEIVVDVHAAGVNPVDFKIRSGALKRVRKDTFPLALGSELSGVVRACGPGVDRFRVGDEVFARVGKEAMGAFAEEARLLAAHAAKKPARLTHVEAASLPLAGLTAYQMLVERGHLARGQRVLVHAASGGVGTLAIQIAHHLGAHVVGVASAKSHPFLRQLGADELIDRGSEAFETRTRDIDLVLDLVGGDTRKRSFAVMRRGGVIVSIAGLPTADYARTSGLPTPVVWIVTLAGLGTARRARARGVRHVFFMMRPDGEQLAALGSLVDAGALQPVIDRVFPLDDAAAALAYVETGAARGKVVLAVKR
jgi:NADPH:quinone reductase-like Zn-dependent oxidoreductase